MATINGEKTRVSLTVGTWCGIFILFAAAAGYLTRVQINVEQALLRIEQHESRLNYHQALLIKQGIMQPEDIVK